MKVCGLILAISLFLTSCAWFSLHPVPPASKSRPAPGYNPDEDKALDDHKESLTSPQVLKQPDLIDAQIGIRELHEIQASVRDYIDVLEENRLNNEEVERNHRLIEWFVGAGSTGTGLAALGQATASANPVLLIAITAGGYIAALLDNLGYRTNYLEPQIKEAETQLTKARDMIKQISDAKESFLSIVRIPKDDQTKEQTQRILEQAKAQATPPTRKQLRQTLEQLKAAVKEGEDKAKEEQAKENLRRFKEKMEKLKQSADLLFQTP